MYMILTVLIVLELAVMLNLIADEIEDRISPALRRGVRLTRRAVRTLKRSVARRALTMLARRA